MKKIGLALVASLSLGACLDATPDSSTDDTTAETTETPRIATNGLTPTAAFSLLNTYPLSYSSSSGLGQSNVASMEAASNGAALVTYLVGCSLSSSDSMTINGTTYYGSAGLATGFKTAAITASAANLVSACVYARLNLTGQNVTVSLRHPNIGWSNLTESGDYAVREGAFWGNVFATNATVAGSSCVGADQAVNDTYGDLPNRECTEQDPLNPTKTLCGLTYYASCAVMCTAGSMRDSWSSCAVGRTTYNEIVSVDLYGTLP